MATNIPEEKINWTLFQCWRNHEWNSFPGTFNILIKCLTKKCSLLPHFPRHFFHKKVPGKEGFVASALSKVIFLMIFKAPGILWMQQTLFSRHFLWVPGPRYFQYFHKKCLEKSVCCIHTIPGALNIFKKITWQKKILNIRTIPGTIKISIKSAWRRSVLCIRTFPSTFYIFKKSAWQKVPFTSTVHTYPGT